MHIQWMTGVTREAFDHCSHRFFVADRIRDYVGISYDQSFARTGELHVTREAVARLTQPL
jgi:hypothetical protein